MMKGAASTFNDARALRIKTVCVAIGWLSASFPQALLAQDLNSTTPFRVAFTSSMFTDVNVNDARASVKAWAASVAKERRIPVDADPRIYETAQDLAEALRAEEVDAAGLTTSEYLALETEVSWGTIFAATIGNEYNSTYLLLVRRDGDLGSTPDLRARRLVIHRNPRTSLIEPWLDRLFSEAELPPFRSVLSEVSTTTKLAQAILPVFFGQVDACAVTQQGFQTLSELNPQIGRDLRVLARSPEVLPTLFCVRAAYAVPALDDLIVGLRELHQTPAGKQVLTVFQSDRLEEIPPSALDSARRLLDADLPAGRPRPERTSREAVGSPPYTREGRL